MFSDQDCDCTMPIPFKNGAKLLLMRLSFTRINAGTFLYCRDFRMLHWHDLCPFHVNGWLASNKFLLLSDCTSFLYM